MATRISCTMVPAVETQLAESRIEDIRSVPGATVELVSGGTSSRCVGLIDTGTDVSVLDETIFRQFSEDVPVLSERILGRGFSILGTGFSKKRIDIYHFTVRIMGDSKEGVLKEHALVFENVPVIVTTLHRPLFIIGRRGVLDRLRVELDFPRKRVVLTRPRRRRSSKYPWISREFSSFQSIMEDIEDDKPTRAILQLSWDLEQFLDRLITEDEVLRKVQEDWPSRSRTLSDKFRIIEKHEDFQGIKESVQALIDARNQAAHSFPFVAPDRASVEALMLAAESVVSRFRRLVP